MSSVYDIIQGINQAAANAHDGAHDEKYSYVNNPNLLNDLKRT